MKDKVNYIETESNLNWDEYFMLQAMIASFRSKDPNTKVGCVFVDEKNHQLTMGYNGFVAGFDESKLPWGKDKTVELEHQKYGYVVHSEANAILHAKTNLKNSRVYVTLFPCHECAKMIATVGVKEVVYLSNKYEGTTENNIAKKIFEMGNIKFRKFEINEGLVTKLNEHLTELSLN
jgi:dCMP deaminase